MSALTSIILVVALILAVIFLVAFAIGHKFRNDNASYGHAMELTGMLGVLVCMIVLFGVLIMQMF